MAELDQATGRSVAQPNGRQNVTCTVTSSNQNKSVAGGDASSDDMYEFGVHVHMKDVKQIPITTKQFWSGFDDYLSIQKVLGLHENTQRVPGTPENGVGAQIFFDYLGGKTYER